MTFFLTHLEKSINDHKTHFVTHIIQYVICPMFRQVPFYYDHIVTTYMDNECVVKYI